MNSQRSGAGLQGIGLVSEGKRFCTCAVMILELLFLSGGVRSQLPGVTHEKRSTTSSVKGGGAINRATCQLNSRTGRNDEKVRLTNISFSQALGEVINSIYNVTTYHILSRWPWISYSHPNIIVVLNREGSVFRKFACGLQSSTRDKKHKKTYQVQKFLRSLERWAEVFVSLFLCQ